MPKVMSVCPDTPYLLKKSKYCDKHHYLEEQDGATKKGRIVVTIDTIDQRVSTKVLPYIDDLTANDDMSVHVGCKSSGKVNRFNERTAGVMAIVQPCGIIVDYAERLTCESPTQLFIQLLRLKCDSNINLKYLGYDRACEFEPYYVKFR